jgi:hypothetical protein
MRASLSFASILLLVGTSVSSHARADQTTFLWQQPHAIVHPQGELELQHQPFRFVAGASGRYIDFENGDDANSGRTKDQPWKHHPWDPNAQANARDGRGPHTYVFKRGVTYRGVFRPGDDRGTADQPIRLTTDPDWGQGEAKIHGSQVVTGWQRQAHEGIETNRDKVWMAEVDFLPRTIWMVEENGDITRLKLARWPNWQESDPNDVLREWPTWENPQWWLENHRFHRTQVNGQDRHLGIDTKNLTRPAEDYIGATVWSEWGIVMGSPYPAEVEAFLEDQKAVAFRGPWTFDMLEVIIRGNRYHLENKPWMLDQPGEFWVEQTGENRGRIYLRLPDDRDPDTVTIEAGRHVNMLDATQLHHVHISGLAFRFNNVQWRYQDPAWAHPDLRGAVIRLNGSGDDILIANNRFEHVQMPIRISVGSHTDRIGTVRINDNIMRHTDHGAAYVKGHHAREGYGEFEHVEMLRNDLYHIGWRALSGEHGHAIDITFPQTSHVAGNFLYRIAGWGISVTGGKPSHGDSRPYGAPLSRHLIHHNRVEDVLLKSNDWGGIETWQGGSFYVFNNLVINPVAFKHWTWREGEPDNIGSFGHAYYLDGAFKNYLFNNIAAGRNNTLGTRSVNTTGLQNIYSFENWFFNNTFYRFAEMTRQQAAQAGRFRYLGNIIEDVSRLTFRHTDPRDVEPDPNAAHYAGGGQYAYHTLAYAQNVFHNLRGRFGAFEETGAVYPDIDGFRDAAHRLNAQAADPGIVTDQSILRDPDARDFRPSESSDALDKDIIVFVPWSLYATVGEWQFTRNNADPSEVIDEHWHMTPMYRGRENYRNTPRYPLQGVDITAESYVPGRLANWTDGSALRLNGQDQYLRIPQDQLHVEADTIATRTTDADFARVTHPERIVPEEPFEVIVQLQSPARVEMHVHWMRENAWGGFSELGGQPQRVEGQGNTFRFTPQVPHHDGLHQYQLIIFLSPDGSFESRTATALVDIPPATFGQSRRAADAVNVNIGAGNFLIEAVLRTADMSGTIAGKMNQSGYLLDLHEGRPRLRLAAGGQQFTATADVEINNEQWRHLLVEVDRQAGARFYVDGRLVPTQASGALPTAALTNDADFIVGRDLAATFDFLRVAQGTLEESQTSIEELYAWQFDGPQFRDFAGNDRRVRNAAGALAQ